MHLLAFAETIQLFPDGTIFIHIALILVMIWVLNRTFYKPINRVIAAREKNKGGRSSEAEEILKDVDEKEANYNRELFEARTRGYELIEKEQKKAAKSREEKLNKVKSEISETYEKGRAELERQSAEARAAISTEAGKIADSIAATILKG